MTNPFARPDQPDSDETIPLVPDSGYADQPSPWSGFESTAIDPLAGDPAPSPRGYTNPVVSSPGPYANPVSPAPTGAPTYPPRPTASPSAPAQLPPTSPAPAASPLSLPPYAPYGSAPTAPAYEQPPAAYGYGPFEPARDNSPAPMVPSYSYVYSPQIEHPNAVPTLVLGLLGFVFGVTFPIAWYLGAKGNAEVKREPQRYRSSGMMTVGMVLGIIGTVFMLLAVLLVVLGLVALTVLTS